MVETAFVARPKVKVAGSPLSEDLAALIREVVIDQSIHLPDMFHVVLTDANGTVLQQAGIEIGTKISIGADVLEVSGGDVLMEGEVTALEGRYDHAGKHVVVRGYDTMHRLHRGRHTETYRNVKDSDIVRKVCSRNGISPGDIADSGTVYDHVSQANLSDYDLLKARAREANFELGVINGKLNFRKPTRAEDGPAAGSVDTATPYQLILGHDLLEFRPRVSSSEQAKEIRVRGWSPREKKVLVGSAQAGTDSVHLRATPLALANKFGGLTYVTTDRPLATQSEVDAAARAIGEQLGSAFAEAEGLARGNQKLKAGAVVNVAGVTPDFCGTYTLTHTRHLFSPHAEYRTWFTVSGRQDRSLLGLTSLGGSNGSASAGGPPIYGVVIGVVTANNDPDKLGRLKLSFPWLSDDYESDWTRTTHLGAGPASGAIFLPEVGDEVLAAFEFGDVRRPYVLGGLWNGKDKPTHLDGVFDNGKLKRRGFVSRKGHKILLHDDAPNSGLTLITSDGKLKVELKEASSEIVISCQGKVSITSGDSMSLESQKDLSLKAKTGLSIETQAQLNLKGDAGLTAQSSAATAVKGSVVQIN